MPATATFTTERSDDRTTIRVSGCFDRGSAMELRQRIEREAAPEVVLDFSLVGEFADLAVAALAAGLAGRRCRLALRGLRTHQLRIFRYFGVDPDALDAPRGRPSPTSAAGADVAPIVAR
jgi:anti-anti-sigma regulatory factor